MSLEHFQKNSSHAVVGGQRKSGLFEFWHRFGSVTGLLKPAPSPKPRQNSKILAPHGDSFSLNALNFCLQCFLICRYIKPYG
jgi:hypothetical protein